MPKTRGPRRARFGARAPYSVLRSCAFLSLLCLVLLTEVTPARSTNLSCTQQLAQSAALQNFFNDPVNQPGLHPGVYTVGGSCKRRACDRLLQASMYLGYNSNLVDMGRFCQASFARAHAFYAGERTGGTSGGTPPRQGGGAPASARGNRTHRNNTHRNSTHRRRAFGAGDPNQALLGIKAGYMCSHDFTLYAYQDVPAVFAAQTKAYNEAMAKTSPGNYKLFGPGGRLHLSGTKESDYASYAHMNGKVLHSGKIQCLTTHVPKVAEAKVSSNMVALLDLCTTLCVEDPLQECCMVPQIISSYFPCCRSGGCCADQLQLAGAGRRRLRAAGASVAVQGGNSTRTRYARLTACLEQSGATVASCASGMAQA